MSVWSSPIFRKGKFSFRQHTYAMDAWQVLHLFLFLNDLFWHKALTCQFLPRYKKKKNRDGNRGQVISRCDCDKWPAEKQLGSNLHLFLSFQLLFMAIKLIMGLYSLYIGFFTQSFQGSSSEQVLQNRAPATSPHTILYVFSSGCVNSSHQRGKKVDLVLWSCTQTLLSCTAK